MKKYIIPLLVIIFVLIADQWLKFWVHANIPLNTHIVVFKDWFQLNYIENNGMAFGFEIGGIAGKIVLTVFRIIAVFAIIWYIFKQIQLKAEPGFIICVSLILAGAIGNIIDSVFYGVIYESQNLPLFQGRVIDMLYFPVIDTNVPEWMPFWKGERFEFFRPVFNIADASISIGIITIMLFQKKFFKTNEETPVTETTTIESEQIAENTEADITTNVESIVPSIEEKKNEGEVSEESKESDNEPKI